MRESQTITAQADILRHICKGLNVSELAIEQTQDYLSYCIKNEKTANEVSKKLDGACEALWTACNCLDAAASAIYRARSKGLINKQSASS